jgi:ketosteroid isomerase-like protein
MKEIVYSNENSKIVERYFQLISKLRNGKEGAVEELATLWNQDGIFKFSGLLSGTFEGIMAITTLYKNRFKANGMEVTLDYNNKEEFKTATLGIVETQVSHVRENKDQVVAGWKTTIGTEQGDGFDISGSHLFTFKNGKVNSLNVTLSSKPEKSENQELSYNDLSIQDVGRLSLAAWPVV